VLIMCINWCELKKKLKEPGQKRSGNFSTCERWCEGGREGGREGGGGGGVYVKNCAENDEKFH
jgi:hypothetical protein